MVVENAYKRQCIAWQWEWDMGVIYWWWICSATYICHCHIICNICHNRWCFRGVDYMEGLAQDCSNSIANTHVILQSCTKPSICSGLNNYKRPNFPGQCEIVSGQHDFQWQVPRSETWTFSIIQHFHLYWPWYRTSSWKRTTWILWFR